LSIGGLPLRRLRVSATLVFFLIASSWADDVQAHNGFGLNDVVALAKKIAAETFVPPKPIPDFLRQLTYDQYRDIRFDPTQALWREQGNFRVEFIHPGLFYTYAVAVNIVDLEGIHATSYSPKLFSFGQNKFGDKVPQDLGFAGFRITYPLRDKNTYNHVLVFAGASYFRSVGKDSVFGLSARGLAIDAALPSGEEFPFFREFWLIRPAKNAREIKILALLDSQRVTGAYEFVLRPGERTIINVTAKLFSRQSINELGIAPLTSMFFYGETKPRPPGEWRPEVHDSDGLLIHGSSGEWIWRPLANPERLQISYFDVENPRGFGLLQRDRNFHNYEDLETRHELRPNAWIVPVGDWGKGKVKLVEIPTPRETNDNIVAYWLPANSLHAGGSFDLAYKIYFHNSEPMTAPLARATATRVARGDKEGLRRIIVDFEGSKIKALPENGPIKAAITVAQDGQLVQQSLYKNAATGGWRLAFQVAPPQGKPLELRALLYDEQTVLSETWTYQLAP
jgi:periplasmic glucans biosynthesis protein